MPLAYTRVAWLEMDLSSPEVIAAYDELPLWSAMFGLLLLDEIAAGLTPLELKDLMGVIRHTREQGVTIIIVEHLMRMILQLCDRIAVLRVGMGERDKHYHIWSKLAAAGVEEGPLDELERPPLRRLRRVSRVDRVARNDPDALGVQSIG